MTTKTKTNSDKKSPILPTNKFIYDKTVLIKPTNFFGNTYFTNYIEWQGEARERLFLEHPDAINFLRKNPDIMIVTHSLHHRFIANTFFGDKIRIEVVSKNIYDYSFMLSFHFFNGTTNDLVGEGWQKLCFISRSSGQPCKVPNFFLELAHALKQK